MILKYSSDHELPPLAWCGQFDFKSHIFLITHGASVEANSNYLVEGVWPGEFLEGRFSKEACFFGSGVRIEDREIHIIPSCATTDCLYYKFSEKNVFVASNSLPFLLASLNDELDPNCFDYDKINLSIADGINEYDSIIPTKEGSVNRLIFHDLVFNGCELAFEEKPKPKPFTSFKDYEDYLKNKYDLIQKNARDVNRRHKIDIFSTQSKGYDSTAVNAIAAPYGLDNTFTIDEAKEVGSYVTSETGDNNSDSGGEICSILNIPCTFIERKSYIKSFHDEYLYYAGMHIAEDANLNGINPYFDNTTVLLTGNLGELWYTEASYSEVIIDSSLRRGDLGGHGLGEIRLKYGFIQIALPFIGARNRSDIFDITHSDEMLPYTLNNNYDRPVPRRIAEEAGIPRGYFGQKKMATVTEFPNPAVPFGKELRNSYFYYLSKDLGFNELSLSLHPIIHWINLRIIFSRPKRYRYLYYFERTVSKLLGRDFKFRSLFQKYNGSLFCFCVNTRAKEYRRILK